MYRLRIPDIPIDRKRQQTVQRSNAEIGSRRVCRSIGQDSGFNQSGRTAMGTSDQLYHVCSLQTLQPVCHEQNRANYLES